MRKGEREKLSKEIKCMSTHRKIGKSNILHNSSVLPIRKKNQMNIRSKWILEKNQLVQGEVEVFLFKRIIPQ